MFVHRHKESVLNRPARKMKRPLAWMFAVGAGAVFSLTGCGVNQAGSTVKSTHSTATNTKLSVFYAGSMTQVMEHNIRPAFDQATGDTFQGRGAGSVELAQMIRSGIENPDVFISASPSVNQKVLMGSANYNLVKWYLTLARDELVIAYAPHSPFASQLKAASEGSEPWYQVLESPGFHLGRTDPALDPKGADTLILFSLAESYYHQPNLSIKILGGAENPQQVYPEESLLAQLTTGQLDAVIAYKHEAVEWGVPYISLPDAINLGDIHDAKAYAKATYIQKNGKKEVGAPIVFTITIPTTAENTAAAEKFVQYMLTGQGHALLVKGGFTPVPTLLSGSKASVPANLQSLIQGNW